MRADKRLIVFFVLAALCACTRKPYNPISADVKAKFNYQPGTYWVYRDTLSGETDSFCVTTNAVQNTDVLNESIFMNIARYDLTAPADSGMLRCVLSQNYIQTYALNITVTYPFTVGTIADVAVLTTGTTYNINGQTFTNVAQITRTIKTPDTYTDTLYMNADVGIIQITEYRKIDTVATTKVFALQKWNIIR